MDAHQNIRTGQWPYKLQVKNARVLTFDEYYFWLEYSTAVFWLVYFCLDMSWLEHFWLEYFIVWQGCHIFNASDRSTASPLHAVRLPQRDPVAVRSQTVLPVPPLPCHVPACAHCGHRRVLKGVRHKPVPAYEMVLERWGGAGELWKLAAGRSMNIILAWIFFGLNIIWLEYFMAWIFFGLNI